MAEKAVTVQTPKARKIKPRITIAKVNGILQATLPDGRVIKPESQAYYLLYNDMVALKKTEGIYARIIIDDSVKRAPKG